MWSLLCSMIKFYLYLVFMNQTRILKSIHSISNHFLYAVMMILISLAIHSHDSLAADVEAGRLKAQVCTSCHGPAGNSENPEIPALAGQPAQALSTALYQFREGNRKNPMMSPFAVNLSNADMNNLAAYFSSQKRAPSSHVTSAEALAQGPDLTVKFNCVQCHSAQLLGQQHIPRIAGQQYTYLLTQLKGFKAMTRADMDGNMSSAASILSDQQIELIADYVSGLNR